MVCSRQIRCHRKRICAQALSWTQTPALCPSLCEAWCSHAGMKSLMLVGGPKVVFSLKPVRASMQILEAFYHPSRATWALPFTAVTVPCRLTPVGEPSPLAESAWLQQLQLGKSRARSRGVANRKREIMRKPSGSGISDILSPRVAL